MKTLVTERDVLDARKKGLSEIIVSPDTVITPGALDAARVHGIPIKKSQSTNRQVNKKTVEVARVIIGADHGGFELKEIIKEYLIMLGVPFEDVGTHSEGSVDYPDFAHAVAQKVSDDKGALGIIIDGAGVGSAITANKVPGIRAATCNDTYTVRNSRLHNNANILTLGSRVIGTDVAKQIVSIWLNTPFEGGRHEHRVNKISDIEKKYLRG